MTDIEMHFKLEVSATFNLKILDSTDTKDITRLVNEIYLKLAWTLVDGKDTKHLQKNLRSEVLKAIKHE